VDGLRNPLDSGRDSLWLAVLVVGAALATVLTILMPLLGVIWAALLLGFGAGRALHGSHPAPARPGDQARSTDGRHRVLVLANEAAAGGALWAELESRCGEGRGEVLIVAPALADSRATLWASDLDGAIEEAGRRLELSLRAARGAGLSAEGRIGDADPNAAIEDALRSFAADEIVIWTHTPDRSPWLERGVVQRAREEVDLPITHVVADPAAAEPDR
jgi:GABA permease